MGMSRLHLGRICATVVALVCLLSLWSVTFTSSQSLSEFPVQFVETLIITIAVAGIVYVGMGPSNLRTRISKILLAAVSLLLTLFLLELPAFIGLVDYRTLLVPKMPGAVGPHNRIYIPHAGFSRPAHDTFNTNQAGAASIIYRLNTSRRYRAFHRYDHNGYRNSRDLQSADVVLIGDSFVEGNRVTQDDILSVKLARVLDLKVANLGQSDYGPMEEYRTLSQFGLPLGPRAVLWFFFEGNDIGEIANFDEGIEKAIRLENQFTCRSLTVNSIESLATRIKLALRPSYGDRRWGLLSEPNDSNERMYFVTPAYDLSDEQLRNLEQVQQVIRSADHDVRESGGSLSFVVRADEVPCISGLDSDAQ